MKKPVLFILASLIILTLVVGCSSKSNSDSAFEDTLLAPKGVKMGEGTSSATLYLSWAPVKDATQYEIYECSTEEGDYSLIGNSSTNYLLITQDNPQNFYYKVKAKKDAVVSEYSEPTKGVAYNANITKQSKYNLFNTLTHPDTDYTVDDINGTVTDKKTGLVWQKCLAGLKGSTCTEKEEDSDDGPARYFGREDAIAYCEGLSLAGKTWRLPEIYELETLIDYTKDPAFNSTIFPNTSTSVQLRTKTDYDVLNLDWRVSFASGSRETTASPTSYTGRVRCVAN